MRQNKTDHNIQVIRSPVNFRIVCSCGWSRTILKQNALARAAKVKAAINGHEAYVRAGGTVFGDLLETE